MAAEVVTINGRKYDKHTGMPLSDEHKTETAKHHATSLHSRTTRSKTLDRRYVKHHKKEADTAKPAPVAAPAAHTPSAPKQAHTITKYAAHKPAPARKSLDGIGPVVHPMVQSVHAAKKPAVTKRVHKPSDVIKAEAIKTALDSAPSHHRKEHTVAKTSKRGGSRMMSLATAGTALLLLGGYFTYLNMPNLSVRVAAARAGIDAQYPSYRPSGYSMAGPIAYDSGKVQMKFAANGGPQSFMLSQERSGWDSDAVLEDYVTPKAGDNYAVTSEGGLTIYTWNGNAAWVSGGILYTVNGDSNLSPDQIRHMAASM
ncbi:MAG TPA: hypothetical protein VL362_02020 [Patescibacteria group bacterium]|jgi:hypothetical protein|nr:hypothetical protein [Patescibacteria group bacterium]